MIMVSILQQDVPIIIMLLYIVTAHALVQKYEAPSVVCWSHTVFTITHNHLVSGSKKSHPLCTH